MQICVLYCSKFIMPGEKAIYASCAHQYEYLMRRGDWQGNILQEIEEIFSLNGLERGELGAGTGHLTRMLTPRARLMWAFEASMRMLETARKVLYALGGSNWVLGVAEHLGEYYACLTEAGFERGWMRTDDRFESLAEVKRFEKTEEVVWPECTAI